MSEPLKHECGIALIRLRKPLSYYKEKYGTWSYGIEKLYLLMEKQHNRGQDGAGVVSVKLHPQPGHVYMDRSRSNSLTPLRNVFDTINSNLSAIRQRPQATESWVTEHVPFAGEVLLGHLRYKTQGQHTIDFVHPVMRSNNWRSRSLAVAGNFTLTNSDEVFQQLVDIGQYPHSTSDTVSLLERMGYLLDRQNDELYERYSAAAEMSRRQITTAIENEIDIPCLLRETTKKLDGGYAICGIIGQGDAFVVRDPHAIRPAFYYADDEVVVVASERPVIQTAFRVRTGDVHELQAGQAIIVKKDGSYELTQVMEPQERKACSFERIYFSRGTDADIYRERKALGRFLVPDILAEIDHDIDHAVFSFIPNTAEVAWFGMMEGLKEYNDELKIERLAALGRDITPEQIREIVSHRVRTEKLAVKDIKLRTFIAEGGERNELAAHVYDITYGSITPGEDSVVVIDDSIVRGTTLKRSIVKILSRLKPKKIVIVSSSPQVRYPDCYGIDMSRMDEFIAFHAAISLLREEGRESLLDEVYRRCKASESLPDDAVTNHVKEVYAPFSYDRVTRRIAEMVTPDDCECPVAIVYQSVEKLSEACPRNNGDWFFSGDYPTPGGVRMVNRAYVRWYENR